MIDLSNEEPAHRAALVEGDGLDRALVCLSSPLGIESLPREQALALIDAYHEGALALGEPFGVWGAIALDRADPDDVDRALARGCVGLSLPAGALAGVDAVSPPARGAGAPRAARSAPADPPRSGAAAGRLRDRSPTRRSPTRCGGRRSRATSPTCTPRGWRSSAPGAPSTPAARRLHDARRARAAARRAPELARRTECARLAIR